MGVRRAFQLADRAIEGNEIVGQEGFQAADPRFDLAIKPPPHGDQDAQDGDEGYNLCPVHGATLADPDVSDHVCSAFAHNEALLAAQRPGQSAPGGQGGTVPPPLF